MNRIIQKQIVGITDYAGPPPIVANNTIIHNTVAGSQREGRRIIAFNTDSFKINYFKLAGVRLRARIATVVGPLNNNWFIDTFLGVEKVLLISTTQIDTSFFCCPENVELFLPLDNYHIFAYINDWQDDHIDRVLVDHPGEVEINMTTGVYTHKTGYAKIHHLPDWMYIQDLANYTYARHEIRGLVEMAELPEDKPTLRVNNEIPVHA